MDPPSAPFALPAPQDAERDTLRRRAGTVPPPPGTYVPRLPTRSRPAIQEAGFPGVAPAPAEVSPAARRCLKEIIELLDRATALLREQTGDAPRRAGRPADVPPSPRLAALELAVSGHDRAEVRRRLASEFSLDDAVRVLDEIFGEGTPGHQRLPGARPADP